MPWLHVLANVAKGLQAGVTQIGIRLGHIGLRAKCRYELVPLASRKFDAGNGREDRRDLASDVRLLRLQRLHEPILDFNFEVHRQADPIVLVL